MAKVLSRLDILLHANTANYVREMKKATDKTKQELKSVADYGKLAGNQLGMAFAGLGSLVSISHIIETADRMQDLASKVRINTQTTEEYNAVLQDLRKISTDYWTAIDGITDLYASSKRALDSLGASQRQVLDFTRNITMAMSVGGGSAQAQEAALIQLGQAMSMGVLRGQEFNSVSAQAPVIIDLLTDSLKVSRGELRSMASEGKITSQVMMDAVLGGYDKLQDTINKMPTTFAQGVQNIKSQYDFLVDDIMNQNSLLSQNLANVALWTAENFRTLVGVGATLGAVWLANIAKNSALVTSFVGLTSATLANTKASIANAFSVQGQINAYNVLSTRLMLLRLTKAHYLDITKTAIATTTAYARSLVGLATSFNTATASARLHTLALAGVATAKRTAMGVGILATRAVTGLGGAFVSLGRVITAHPIIALTAVIGAVIARTEGLSGAVKSLGDAFSVAGVLAVDFVGGVVDGLGRAWTATANYFNSFMGGTNKAVSFSQTAFGGFFAGTQKGFVGVLQITARVFDRLGAVIVGTVKTAYQNITSFLRNVQIGFITAFNAVAQTINNVVGGAAKKINGLLDSASQVAEVVGISVPTYRLPTDNIVTLKATPTALPALSLSQNIANSQANALEGLVNNANDRVQQSANRASTANLGLGTALNNVASASDKAGKGVDKAGRANKGVAESAKLAQDEIDKLNQAYVEQIRTFQRTEWELHKPFITELDKIDFEIEYGQFVHALDKQKEDLRKLARNVDQSKNIDILRKLDTGWAKEIAMLGKENSLDNLLYDLNDISNVLSTFDKEHILSITYDEKTGEVLEKTTAYHYYLKQAVNYDISKATYELNNQNLELYNQLELLTARDEVSKSFITLQQDKVAFLGKYNGLLDNGFETEYQALQAQYERHEQLKRDLLVQTEYWELQDKIAQTQKELATLGTDGLARELLAIEQEKADTLKKYNHLLNDGYNDQFALIEQQANALEYQQKQVVITKQYNDLVQSLKTDEQKRLDTLKEQLNVLTAHNQVMGANLDIEQAKQLISQSVGLEVSKNAYDELNGSTANKFATLDMGVQSLLDNERLTEQERINIKEWGASERLKIEQAHTLAMNELILTDSQNIFGSLTSIVKDGLGEHSRAYRAMFAIEKGFAIARSVIAIQQAIALASANPFPMNLGAMATVASQVASIVSNIKAVQMPVGQAHDGIMSVPKSGTWNLEKGERVLPKHTAQNLDNTLNNIKGGKAVNVIIHNHTGEKVQQTTEANGDIRVIIGQELAKQLPQHINNPYSDFNKSLKQNYNLERKL